MIEERIEWFMKNWEHHMEPTGFDHDFMVQCNGCCRALVYFLLGVAPKND